MIPAKIEELEKLHQNYKCAIEKQNHVLKRVLEGELDHLDINTNILLALVKGDLKLLIERNRKVTADIENLKRLCKI